MRRPAVQFRSAPPPFAAQRWRMVSTEASWRRWTARLRAASDGRPPCCASSRVAGHNRRDRRPFPPFTSCAGDGICSGGSHDAPGARAPRPHRPAWKSARTSKTALADRKAGETPALPVILPAHQGRDRGRNSSASAPRDTRQVSNGGLSRHRPARLGQAEKQGRSGEISSVYGLYCLRWRPKKAIGPPFRENEQWCACHLN